MGNRAAIFKVPFAVLTYHSKGISSLSIFVQIKRMSPACYTTDEEEKAGGLPGFEASLVYIASSRQPVLLHRKQLQKETTKTQHSSHKENFYFLLIPVRVFLVI